MNLHLVPFRVLCGSFAADGQQTINESHEKNTLNRTKSETIARRRVHTAPDLNQRRSKWAAKIIIATQPASNRVGLVSRMRCSPAALTHVAPDFPALYF